MLYYGIKNEIFIFGFINDKLCHLTIWLIIGEIMCFTNFKLFYKTKNPWRIYFHECNEYTESIEPIILRRYQVDNFCIYAICDKCKLLKIIALTDF